MTKNRYTLGLLLGGLVLGAGGCPAGNPTVSDDAAVVAPVEKFSFFVTSLKVLQELSGSQLGFGGDLRFGETGPGAGLRGADKICATIAERSMPGAGKKNWRAFLSAVADDKGIQVNAIDRIGNGPWYDRLGRAFALSKQDLMNVRPASAHPAIQNDFPNEDGVPNHRPDPNQPEVDNHDMLTGTNDKGQLYSKTATCKDWTANLGDKASEGLPRVGHSWPRGGFMTRPDMGGGMRPDLGGPRADLGGGPRIDMGGGPLPDLGFPPPGDGGFPPRGDGGFPPRGDGGGFPPIDDPGGNIDSWMSSLTESGCAPGVNLIEMGPPMSNSNTVGSGGGYGGFYCFAMTP
jgi:hypothetical protein